MKDVLIIIQARMGSTRLPGKIMMDLKKEAVVFRIQRICNKVAATVIAIPETELSLADTLSHHEYFKGSELDVLKRYYDCAQRYPEYKHIVRITADCPFISADMIRIAIAVHKSHNAEYTCFDKVVSGLDVEVFTREALEKAHKSAESAYDREHVTPWMKNTLHIHRIKKLSLDTPQDFEYLKRIEGQLHG